MANTKGAQLIKLMNDLKNRSIKIILLPRPKNKAFRPEQGITVQETEDIIRSIEIADYYQGPEKDYDPNFNRHDLKKEVINETIL